jgi:hypothetical protein
MKCAPPPASAVVEPERRQPGGWRVESHAWCKPLGGSAVLQI